MLKKYKLFAGLVGAGLLLAPLSAFAVLTLGATSETSDGILTLQGAAGSVWSTSAGNLDVDSAASLRLGTSTATTIVLGRAGVPTTVSGSLAVTAATTLTGALVANASSTLATTTIAGGLTVSNQGVTVLQGGGAFTGPFSASSTANSAGTITLNENGGTAETILIRSQQGTGATSLNLVSSAGGITLNAANAVAVTASATVGTTLGVTGNTTLSGTLTTATTTIAGGLTVSNQGVTVLQGGGAFTGPFSASSTANSAGTITLNENGGTAETILIQSQQGTGAAALNLVSSVGGITLNAGNGVTVTASATVGTTLTVTGAATLSSTLAVTGTSSLNSVLVLEKSVNNNVSANAVTVNKTSGTIVDSTAINASSTRASITLTDSRIVINSILLTSICSTPDAGAKLGIAASSTAAGTAILTVYNSGGGNQANPYTICFLVTN